MHLHTRRPSAAGRAHPLPSGSAFHLAARGKPHAHKRPPIENLDLLDHRRAIVAHPETYGLSNATAACLTPNNAPFTCQNPDDYLFWDGIHPTQAGHAVLAAEAAHLVR
jgi:hypothetical protein